MGVSIAELETRYGAEDKHWKFSLFPAWLEKHGIPNTPDMPVVATTLEQVLIECDLDTLPVTHDEFDKWVLKKAQENKAKLNVAILDMLEKHVKTSMEATATDLAAKAHSALADAKERHLQEIAEIEARHAEEIAALKLDHDENIRTKVIEAIAERDTASAGQPTEDIEQKVVDRLAGSLTAATNLMMKRADEIHRKEIEALEANHLEQIDAKIKDAIARYDADWYAQSKIRRVMKVVRGKD